MFLSIFWLISVFFVNFNLFRVKFHDFLFHFLTSKKVYFEHLCWKKGFDQLLGARSTQKLVEIHNSHKPSNFLKSDNGLSCFLLSVPKTDPFNLNIFESSCALRLRAKYNLFWSSLKKELLFKSSPQPDLSKECLIV